MKATIFWDVMTSRGLVERYVIRERRRHNPEESSNFHWIPDQLNTRIL
jgi:hypothetical protein